MIRRSQCVCVCVFTQISHISKFTRHFFEYRYMHDAADNSMLPEHIIIFPQTDCKSECIFHLLKSAAKVAFFNGKKEENPRKFEGKFKENAHNEGLCGILEKRPCV